MPSPVDGWTEWPDWFWIVIAGTEDCNAGVALAEGGTLDALTVLMWNVPFCQDVFVWLRAYIVVDLMILLSLMLITLVERELLGSKLEGRLGAEYQLSEV
jgi:hypothetical protein